MPPADVLTTTMRGTVLEAGADWEAATGRAADDLVLRPMEELLETEAAAHVRSRLDRVAAGLVPSERMTWTLRHRAGHPVRVEVGIARRRVRAAGPDALDISLLEQPASRVPSRGAIYAAWCDRSLSLVAQPICDVDTLATVRHELLVRLTTADGRTHPAAVFLPALERLGLLLELDALVLDRAVRMLAAGDLGGSAIEVNVSAHTVREPAPVLGLLERKLGSTRTDPRRLVLAVPAGALELGRRAVGDFVEAAHDIGCTVALDGVGASPEELESIATLHVDTVKIEASVVREAARGPATTELDRVVDAARVAGSITVGEAVESHDALGVLRRHGVHHGQGWHLGEPVRTADLGPRDGPRR